jgi:cell division protein FtsA
MVNSKYIFALDLGTTKFCLGILNHSSHSESPQVNTIKVPAQGMKKGMLSDLSKAKQALETLIELFEEKYRFSLAPTVVGIAGSHLKSQTYTYEQHSDNPLTISQRLLTKIKDQALKDFLSSSNKILHEVIHIIPTSYQINNREKIENPLGFNFNSLKIEYFIVTADKSYLTDILSLCNSCGIVVKNLYAEPYASASVLLTPQLKKIGASVVDIGGGTCDGIVFANGYPQKIFTVNIGGKLITNDLSIGLGISTNEAERIKTALGLNDEDKESLLRIKDIYNEIKVFPKEKIQAILQPRIAELGHHLHKNIQPYLSSSDPALILTGGGSEIINLPNFLQKILPYNIKRIQPQIPIINPDKSNSLSKNHLETKYATVLGLLYLEITNNDNFKQKNKIIHYFKNVFNWINELT